MKEFQYKIKDSVGIHARTCRIAGERGGKVFVGYTDKNVG